MKNIQRTFVIVLFSLLFAVGVSAQNANPATDAKSGLPQVTPAELVKILQSSDGEKPLIFQVGFRVLYAQAHIPGSEYVGASSTKGGLAQLQKRVESLAKNKFIVLYCGCCPWARCPNLKPAFEQLRKQGFTNVKVLYIADNFGANWVEKGYPVAKGE